MYNDIIFEATAAALGLGARVAVDQALFDPLSARFPGCDGGE